MISLYIWQLKKCNFFIMKRYILILFLVFTPFIFAQQVEIIKSSRVTNEKKSVRLHYGGKTSTGEYIVLKGLYMSSKPYPVEFVVERYDQNFKFIQSKTIQNSYPAYFKTAYLMNDTLHLFVAGKSAKQKEFVVFQYQGDVNKMTFSSKKIYRIDKKYIKDYYRVTFFFVSFSSDIHKKDLDNYGYVNYSDKKNYTVLSVDLKDPKKEAHLVVVFDRNMNKVFEKLLTLDIKDRMMDIKQVEIDDEGNVYMLTKNFLQSNRRAAKRVKKNFYQDVYYTLYKINSERIISHKIESKYFILQPVLLLENNQVVTAGFFSQNFKRTTMLKMLGVKPANTALGTFRMSFNPADLQVKSTDFKFFDEQTQKSIAGSEYKRYKKHNIPVGLLLMEDLYFRFVHVDDDGKIIFHMEPVFEHIYYDQVGMARIKRRTHIYGIIYAVTIDKSANATVDLIIKNQETSANTSMVSYASTYVNDTHYFFLNTHKITKKGYLTGFGKSFLEVRVKKGEKPEIKALADYKKNQLYFLPRQSVTLDNLHEIIIPRGYKKKFSLALIKIH